MARRRGIHRPRQRNTGLIAAIHITAAGKTTMGGAEGAVKATKTRLALL